MTSIEFKFKPKRLKVNKDALIKIKSDSKNNKRHMVYSNEYLNTKYGRFKVEFKI